jgi:hypothetical protein
MEPLFETDYPLWPENPAYSEVFAGYEGGIRPHKLVHRLPAVICSPRKTGKTTQLRRIFKLQEQFKRDIEGISIVVPVCEGGFSERNFRDLLADELKATEAGSVVDILESSKRITEKSGERVLAVVDADNLHEDALRWLLYGLRNITEASRILEKAKVQIIVDGSFSVDTMTSGPDSEFPMPQLYPREFNETEQREFICTRLTGMSLSVSDDTYKALWRVTLGDKYFTQALCKRLVRRSQEERTRFVSIDQFNECLTSYVSDDKSDQLKIAVLRSLRDMSEEWASSDVMLRSVTKNIASEWKALPKYIRAIAYKGGLVRRTGLSGVQLRAPLVLEIYDQVERRVRQVKMLLDSHFEIHGVPNHLQGTAKGCLEEIIDAAFDNSLISLHVGFGRKITSAEIDVNAIALDHGQYEGTIHVRTDDSIKRGDELWCLFWTREDVDGGSASKFRTLPVKPVNAPHEK